MENWTIGEYMNSDSRLCYETDLFVDTIMFLWFGEFNTA